MRRVVAAVCALLLMGVSHVSAEMITVDPDQYANLADLTVIDSAAMGAPSLPDAHLYPLRLSGYSTGNFTYRVVAYEEGGVRFFAGERYPDDHEYYTAWSNVVNVNRNDSVKLRVDFVSDGSQVDLGSYNVAPAAPESSQFAPVSVVEVDFRSNHANGDWGWLEAFDASGVSLGSAYVDLSTASHQTGTARFERPDGDIAQVRLCARDSGTDIYIEEIRYGTGTEIVPEPGSLVNLFLGGLVGLGLFFRRRQAP